MVSLSIGEMAQDCHETMHRGESTRDRHVHYASIALSTIGLSKQ